ncbi:hypothetical protein IQ270_02225 [Microcoleus sp. LEGE 07076]|uniref:hypothetical protein n=1 Tax=Microcoleus sp. LEGE 07076 TaxID=915322 RepID=UPI0018807446|nr:hypothetical protein [Microcoleus sp. LEGE 07076]MBE9183570.1 hypothetical protein [Microcoleus sp. LEGE 07076]
MTQQPQLPEPEKVKQTVTQMREVCRQFDSLNFALDELIAQIEADIRKSPLTAYRLGKIQPVSQATESER